MTDLSSAPVKRADRIAVLDILRGFAILGIFYMNSPYMGANVNLLENDITSIGWTIADRNSWAVINTLLEGTQRGLLQMLFGAGMLVLARRAMEPDGPVAVADLYYRRNLWLIAFGLLDVFVLLWPGDILHVYGLAALFLFPFRRLSPKWLVTIGLAFAAFTAIGGGVEYADRVQLKARVEAIEAKVAQGKPLTADDKKAQAELQKIADKRKLDKDEQKKVAEERKVRSAGTSLAAYAQWAWGEWIELASSYLLIWVIEAFCAMLIGAALWKWGIIQGQRTARFYLVTMIIAYAYGLGARALGVSEILTFSTIPKTIWINWEFARLATVVGHIALINLLVKSAAGAAILSPLKAPGRMAFSLYFLQQILGMFVIFSPFGLGLWAQYSWAGIAAIATAVIALEIVIANIWARYFAAGPLEWLWRSLSYLKWQPFRLRRSSEDAASPVTI